MRSSFLAGHIAPAWRHDHLEDIGQNTHVDWRLPDDLTISLNRQGLVSPDSNIVPAAQAVYSGTTFSPNRQYSRHQLFLSPETRLDTYTLPKLQITLVDPTGVVNGHKSLRVHPFY